MRKFYGAGTHRLGLDTFRRFAEQFSAQGPKQLSYAWQGGEPTLMGLEFFKRAMEVELAAARRGQNISNGLQTNGQLIDEHWCKFFKEYKFLIGLSIDGPRQLHDRFRKRPDGAGSFEQAWRALELLREHDVEFNILSVVSTATADHAAEIYEFFVSHGIKYLQFIPALSYEQAQSPGGVPRREFEITAEQYGKFLCDLFDAWYTPTGLPEVYERTFDDFFKALIGIMPEQCCLADHCGGSVVLEHNGDIYPCDFSVTPEQLLGNIHHHSLTRILNDGRYARFMSAKTTELNPKCFRCEWFAACHGGCPRYRVKRNDMPKPHDLLCEARLKFFGYAKDRLLQLRERWLAQQQLQTAFARPIRRKVRPNDPCPCGSGLKYKRCCGAPGSLPHSE